MATVAVKNHLAVARSLDNNRLLRSSVDCQHIGAVKGDAVGRHIVKTVGLIEARVNQDHVTGLHRTLPYDTPVAGARTVIGFLEAAERRFLPRSGKVRRINVERSSTLVDSGFAAGGDGHLMNGLSHNPVRIGQSEAAFVAGFLLQVENRTAEMRSTVRLHSSWRSWRLRKSFARSPGSTGILFTTKTRRIAKDFFASSW